MTLRARLILLALLITVPALATAWLALQATYTRERAAIERTLRETTKALSLVVDRELRMREAVAWSLSGSPSLASGDLQAFHSQATAAMGHLGGWVVLVDAQQERQLVNTLKPWGSPLPEHQGLSVAPAAGDGGAKVSGLYKGPAAEKLVVAVSVPVTAGDKRGYSLGIVMEPERLQRVLEEQGLPSFWTAAVIDGAGQIVARQPHPQRWIGKLATDDVRRRIAAQAEGLFQSRTLDGVAVTTYFSRSPVYGWTFIIGVPDTVIGASLRRSVLQVGSVAALLVGLSIALSVVAFRRVSARVKRLQTTARQLEAGEPAAFEPTAVPELDEIGRTLVSASNRIRHASEHLERQVALAVDEVRRTQERLAESQRLEALGRLTGGVAHDVNNLLAVVANNVFVLQRQRPDAPQAEPLAAIRRAVETGRQLTQKLLAFSRRRTMQPQRLALADWLPSTAPLLRSSLARGIGLQVDVDPDVPPLEVDPVELELALVNLAVNANDAMPAGGRLTIRVRFEPAAAELSGRDCVLIDVADTGEGIAPELLDKVFEPFFTTKDVSRGSGLGLSQVYGFCAQSGGTVRIDSVVGRGTTVTMVLPAAAAVEERQGQRTAAEAPAAPTAAATAAPTRAGLRVLYVEDNEDLGRVTVEALGALGFSVQWSPDASDALRRLEQSQFDVVLSDIVMPGDLDGLALAIRLRDTRPTLPVVLLTGYSDRFGAAVAAGFEVLQKPCPPEVIADAIARQRPGPAGIAAPA